MDFEHGKKMKNFRIKKNSNVSYDVGSWKMQFVGDIAPDKLYFSTSRTIRNRHFFILKFFIFLQFSKTIFLCILIQLLKEIDVFWGLYFPAIPCIFCFFFFFFFFRMKIEWFEEKKRPEKKKDLPFFFLDSFFFSWPNFIIKHSSSSSFYDYAFNRCISTYVFQPHLPPHPPLPQAWNPIRLLYFIILRMNTE